MTALIREGHAGSDDDIRELMNFKEGARRFGWSRRGHPRLDARGPRSRGYGMATAVLYYALVSRERAVTRDEPAGAGSSE